MPRTLFFVNFVTLKTGDDPNNQASSVIWLLVNSNALDSCPKESWSYLLINKFR